MSQDDRPTRAAAPALELMERVGVEQIGAQNVRLANRFQWGIGLRESNSAIVSADVPGAARRLATAGIRAATRAGQCERRSIYSTGADVDAAAISALSG